MKKEIPPQVVIGVIVALVAVIGLWMYNKASNNDPTPRPDPKYFGISSTGAPASKK